MYMSLWLRQLDSNIFIEKNNTNQKWDFHLIVNHQIFGKEKVETTENE